MWTGIHVFACIVVGSGAGGCTAEDARAVGVIPAEGPTGRAPGESAASPIAGGEADGESVHAPTSRAAIPRTSRVYSPPSAADVNGRRRRTVVPAIDIDRAYDRGGQTTARRLVYRLDLHIPTGFGAGQPSIARPSAELTVDLTRDRLRARFDGDGCALAPGTEVRLRGDQRGTYVFDADGGRPLPPGRLAGFFEGGDALLRQPPPLRIEPAEVGEGEGPGTLLCALLAEWSGVDRDELAHRCGSAGSPVRFRVGPWYAERTADVGIEVAVNSLRADHVDPPTGAIAPNRGRPTFEVGSWLRRPTGPPSLAAAAGPSGGSATAAGDGPQPGPDPPIPSGRGTDLQDEPVLVVTNASSTRMAIVASGVPVAWLESGETGYFVAPAAASYRIGALRPLGRIALWSRNVTVPGDVRIR